MSTFARTVLDIAAEVESAETRLKEAILAAAREGDCARVIDIVSRWMTVPATEVLPEGEPSGAGEEARRC